MTLFSRMLMLWLSAIFSSPNETNVSLDRLQQAADFDILIPSSLLVESNRFEVKEPYPIHLDRPITRVRLHYLDPAGNKYIFGIEEHKAIGYKVRRVEIYMDVQKHTSVNKVIVDDFKFDADGEQVYINGCSARFVPWANHLAGGRLRWIQGDTYVEMDSGQLSKEKMIEYARSFQSVATKILP